MTDLEYIRMRQEEGRSVESAHSAAPARQHSSRLAALLRLTRRAQDGRPAGRLQRQP